MQNIKDTVNFIIKCLQIEVTINIFNKFQQYKK